MKSLSRMISAALDKGGVLAIGLGCMFLYKQQYRPDILGPLSYGMLSVGAVGVARYVLTARSTTEEKADYKKLLVMIDERKSEIQANTDLLEELRAACESFMAMRRILEGWRKDPSLVQDKITILDELLRTRDSETSMFASKGSTRCAVSDITTAQCSSSASQIGTDTGSEDIGETMARNMKNKPRGDLTEKLLEEIAQEMLQEVLQGILEEVAGSILDEDTESVLDAISRNMQKQMYERIQTELPEDALWQLSEKSVEEIMEKVQKDLFEKVREGAFEIVKDKTFEMLQEDVPEEKQELVVESVEERKAQKFQVKIPKTKVSQKHQQDLSEKELETVPQNQSDEVPQNLVDKKPGNVLDDIFKRSFQQLSMNEELEKQQEHAMVTAEPQITEHEDQEKLEMDLAEALVETESEVDRKDI